MNSGSNSALNFTKIQNIDPASVPVFFIDYVPVVVTIMQIYVSIWYVTFWKRTVKYYIKFKKNIQRWRVYIM